MSIRIGNPQQTNFPATVLGGASGVSIAVNNSGWALFISAVLTYNATLTVGNRQVVVDVRDSANNLIWRSKGTAYVVAGQTAIFALGRIQSSGDIELRVLQQITASGLGVLDELDAIRSDIDSNTPPMMQAMPLPEGFSIPVNSVIRVFDFNAVDTNDTAQATIIFTL